MARPADVEGGLVAYLNGVLDVPVSTRVPSVRPAKFVRLYLVGGTRSNLAQSRSLVFLECWAASETAAFDLAADTWQAIADADGSFLSDGVWLADGESGLSTPVSNDDPESGTPRYTFTANVTVNLQESA